VIKAITFLITALINTGIGAFLFFMLLLSLNGFSEKQATPGLILFIGWVLLGSIVAGILGFLSANYLIENKSINQWLAALIAIAVFVIVGALINIIGFFAAIFLTSAMR
jgi:hypothetical protein